VQQSVSLVTLGVADYARAKAFYEAMGWSAAWEDQETTFFQANGVVLVLWGREKLAADTGRSSPYWYIRGYLTEARSLLEVALAADEQPTAPRARALNGAAG
jgi:uncharacterized protein